jgi:tetratricopeptide (TPR) repeat protein
MWGLRFRSGAALARILFCGRRSSPRTMPHVVSQLFRSGSLGRNIRKTRRLSACTFAVLITMSSGPFAQSTSLVDRLVQQIGEYGRAGRHVEATPLIEQVVAELEKEVGRKHPKYVDALSLLSAQYGLVGRLVEAESNARIALALRREIVGPVHVDLARNLANLATVLGQRKKYAESENVWRQAISIYTAAAGTQDTTTADYLNALALQYAVQARYAESVPAFKDALQIRSRNPIPGDPKTSELLIALARSEIGLDRYEDAATTLQRAKEFIQSSVGLESPVYARLLSEEARLALQYGNLPEAERVTKQALAIFTNTMGPEAQETVMSLAGLGLLIAMQGRYEEAHPLHLKALEIRERTLGPDHLDTAESLLNVAGSLANQERLDLAVDYQRRALSAYAKNLGDNHPDVAFAHQKLGWFLWQLGQHDEAHAQWSKAVRIHEERKEIDTPRFANLLDLISGALLTQKDYRTSEGLALRARAIMEAKFGPGHPALFPIYNHLTSISSYTGDLDGVLKYFDLAKGTQKRNSVAGDRFGTRGGVGDSLGSPGSSAPLAVLAAWYVKERTPALNDQMLAVAFVADQYADQSVAGTAVSLWRHAQARKIEDFPNLYARARTLREGGPC